MYTFGKMKQKQGPQEMIKHLPAPPYLLFHQFSCQEKENKKVKEQKKKRERERKLYKKSLLERERIGISLFNPSMA